MQTRQQNVFWTLFEIEAFRNRPAISVGYLPPKKVNKEKQILNRGQLQEAPFVVELYWDEL